MLAHPPNGPLPNTMPLGGTAAGAAQLRIAIGRLRTVVSLALATSVLVLVESYLSAQGVFSNLPKPGAPFDVSWTIGVQLGLGVALGVAIVVLVVGIVVLAILGLVAWRRGVRGMTDAAPEFGPVHTARVREARRDHTTTLWLFLGLVLAAIVVSVAFAGINGTAAVLGVAPFPGVVGSVATSLATGLVLVGIYYYGARHLVGFLYDIASAPEQRLLVRGRTLLVVGAVVGLGAAFSAALWACNAFAVISLALILPGVAHLEDAYDGWLAEHRPYTVPAPASRPVTA